MLDVLLDLTELLEDGGLRSAPDVDELFALYRALPSYAIVMYAADYLRHMERRERSHFWEELRALVDAEDDRLADPLVYWLWCDPFEDEERVAEAWEELTQPGALGSRGLRRVLHASGPVPWSIKEPVLLRLVAEHRWHAAILDSLIGSTFDYLGSVDRARARKLLDRLNVGRRSAAVASLRRELGKRRRR